MKIQSVFAAVGALASSLVLAPVAWAQDAPDLSDLPVIGKPVPGGTGFQPAATSLARDIHWLDSFILVIITVIVLFVTALLAWVIVRYNRKRQQDPATFTHNSTIEVAWTLVPILILIVIGSFSLPTLFNQLEIPEADVTVKATGNQWFWSYEYPDNDVSFDSYMLGAGKANMDDEVRAELAEYGYSEDEWLLATDTAVVVPVNKVVRMQVTAGDVIHSWTIPAFGVKIDAVPGRLNETWFRAEQEGVYFGQCSELCGMYHAYMPITVKVVSEEQYAQWIESEGGVVAGLETELKVAEAD